MAKYLRVFGLLTALLVMQIATVLITMHSMGVGQAGTESECVPGDNNGDGIASVADAIYLLNYLFQDGDVPVVCAQEPQLTDAELAILQEILPHVSVTDIDDGAGTLHKTIRFSDVNVQIVSGSGATNGDSETPHNIDPDVTSVNGLGNLIIGYNESSDSSVERGGSHNLILGTANNYSSFGGVVAGQENSTSAAHASVLAGHNNSASGSGACVSGGIENQAAGSYSSVSGGRLNEASGDYSSILGGGGLLVEDEEDISLGNVASGEYSVVAGGSENLASGTASCVCGGVIGEATGLNAVVVGGSRNRATGDYSTVTGGGGGIVEIGDAVFDLGNEASGVYASVTGGHTNTASGTSASVSGGASNLAAGDASSVSGGNTENVLGVWDWAAGSLFEED